MSRKFHALREIIKGMVGLNLKSPEKRELIFQYCLEVFEGDMEMVDAVSGLLESTLYLGERKS